MSDNRSYVAKWYEPREYPKEFIREKDRQNWEFWEAYNEARKPMEELMKKWMDAREEMNRPIREYLDQQWTNELYE